MSLRFTRWEGSEISVDKIREVHVPNESYRISPCSFEPGVRFAGATREGIVYITSGSCQWRMDGKQVTLAEGDVIHHPSGSYDFQVIGDRSCELVHVWNLEEIFEQCD